MFVRYGAPIYRISIGLLFSWQSAFSQAAQDYFPDAPGARWDFHVTYFVEDSVQADFTRIDSLVNIIHTGDERIIDIRSDPGDTARYVVRGDTVFTSPEAMNLDVLLAALEIDFSDGEFSRLPAFRFDAGPGESWQILDFQRRIAIPAELRAGLPTNVDDTVTVFLTLTGSRLDDAEIDLPYGTLSTSRFQASLGLDARFTIRIFGLPITRRETLITDLTMVNHLAPNMGIVAQYADPYYVMDPISSDENVVFTVPGQEVEMAAFQEGPAVFVYDEGPQVPGRIVLDQNYPNPFNPSTTIAFRLDVPGEIDLTIYTLTGQVIHTLASSVPYPAGWHSLPFDAAGLASGTYIYQLRVVSQDRTVNSFRRMMTVLK